MKQQAACVAAPPGGFQPRAIRSTSRLRRCASHFVIVSPMHQGGLITPALLQATQLRYDHRTPLPVQAHGTAFHRKQEGQSWRRHC